MVTKEAIGGIETFLDKFAGPCDESGAGNESYGVPVAGTGFIPANHPWEAEI
jgi:hypothetical protein